MKTHKWSDLKAAKLTEEQTKQLDAQVKKDLAEMSNQAEAERDALRAIAQDANRILGSTRSGEKDPARLWERIDAAIMKLSTPLVYPANTVPVPTPAPAPADPHGWIQTFTGKKFFPLAPDIDAICIEDIAHALSNLCRYTGHTKHFYSVAEHSLWVSHQVPREHALAGLLHDATEAYLIDLAKPVKRLAEMKPYRDAEDRLAAVIAKKFGLETLEPPEVKEADLRMLATEAPQIMAPLHPEWKVAAEPYGITVMCWEPGMAREIFLHRFRELTR